MTFTDIFLAVCIANALWKLSELIINEIHFESQRKRMLETLDSALESAMEARNEIVKSMKSEPVNEEVETIK